MRNILPAHAIKVGMQLDVGNPGSGFVNSVYSDLGPNDEPMVTVAVDGVYCSMLRFAVVAVIGE